MKKIALVVGATGITGSNLAQELVSQGWQTYGLARHPENLPTGVIPIQADLFAIDDLQQALQDVAPTHLFINTWVRRATEAENVKDNATMVRNVLDVLSSKKTVQHVALVTGLKHYLGPFEAYAKEGALPETPLREEQPRLDLPNFYYAQEDEVYAAAQRDGFSWSVHRPHTVIGKAVGNLMNLGSTLAVYASICKHTGRKFIWPGSAAQWEGLSDVTDASILAKQLIWASTTEGAKNTAFNIVNGDVFRWKWLWPRIADWFGISAVGYAGAVRPLAVEMQHDAAIWQAIAQQHGLVNDRLSSLASPWHTDLDLGRPIEVMTDMKNSRTRGFSAFQSTENSFFTLFARLRDEKIIP
ncbi:SDR family oxidoreductase [Sphingobacterium oryzagri]|uniref:SDR family oxidoreductase n=1 Tax=Sphingobacterium oryzagri TaxID=3025669 RepID=A0ABY7WM23_9SPHI|nr:SDR family oxidoreductase [Sphingobacterium sp. KACC 22765]WDF70550.1 SDR family oxidoreductase [Sphingobacterium sp. KACC 22765]